MKCDVLIVEDEPKIADLVADYLRKEGLKETRLQNGDAVLPWLTEHQTRLILLDLMLPGRDGLSLCTEIRALYPMMGIIMLTARVEEADRLSGLETGADDYICKPFSPRELMARCKALLRRLEVIQPSEYPTGFKLTPENWQATLDGHELNLTAIEFQLLAVMMTKPDCIFTREQLMDKMYRDHRIVSARTVDSHIKKLRKKIADLNPTQEIIQSVYGVGYRYLSQWVAVQSEIESAIT